MQPQQQPRVRARQQPGWPDASVLSAVVAQLSAAPPLVFGPECEQLRAQLAAVARGEAFLLQGGDCAETFGAVTADGIRGKLRTLLQMAVVLTYGASVPVVKVGRLAGQFAKPRSSAVESRDGTALPSYRGDAVNGLDFTAKDRTPDPRRLLTMYEKSAVVLNLVRAFAGSDADLHRAHTWNQGFVADSPGGSRYAALAAEIDRALAFMSACGVDPGATRSTDVWASHEGLLLDYERALVRRDTTTGKTYATSGHLLWIGERTREPDGAHVEFFSRIANPVAVKLGPAATPDEVLGYVERLDPAREPGRLTFVVRMGAANVRNLLPPLIEKTVAEGIRVGWVCDPMHGNTFTAPDGRKTRHMEAILDEVEGFFEVHRDLGTAPGGIHVELTGDDVTECVGGSDDIQVDQLHRRYETACDPRLNRSQSLDLAFRVAEMLRESSGAPDASQVGKHPGR
ncbi:class II 3-deoxy-7-phosphoheptulonate synthase [Streptomyces sp. TRM68367]|uniref:class II 3-deoxy-7-phosphoheptulonate synthase n=1 Tax=Streptomyces sp. TRM68367 TaxID=2758415 RepID=UPI00165CE448|nr:3-deoxy-7-phosphoheptulonate synthase class II [Streptomyces sp. TRM68367]MBC9727097.1 3-deoxy-7-phosphoheptulonate synthase class II [Streptomyces sp. TRM68367]